MTRIHNKLSQIFRETARSGFKIFAIFMADFVYRKHNPYSSISLYKKDIKISRINKDFTNYKSTPPITSITPVLNEEKNIVILLSALEKQSITPSEVIIIDGGSKDKTIDNIKKFKSKSNLNIIILKSPIKRNIGAQRNCGLKHATHELILNLDAGTHLTENYIANMVGPFIEDSNIDLVGGWVKAKQRDVYSYMFCQDKFFVNRIEPYGASVLYKKSKALKIGGYPEYLTYAAEDTIFFYKYHKISSKWVFNEACYILWDIPHGLKNVQNKLNHYFLGGFESGLWAFMYYQYILYPRLYKMLGRWAPNFSLFSKHYKEYTKKQASIEVKKRKIKNIYFILANEPIYSPREEKLRAKAYRLINENNKVFFICQTLQPLELLKKPNQYSMFNRIKFFIQKSIGIIKQTPLEKIGDNLYLDTDITLLEIMQLQDLDMKELERRYGKFLYNSKHLINETNKANKAFLEKTKKYCK